MRIISLAALVVSLALPAYAKNVTCADGTTSKSGRGACSHHGGVAAAQPAPEAAEKPAGTVTCKGRLDVEAGPGCV